MEKPETPWMKTISLSIALEGYDLACRARHLSLNTIAEYWNTYRHLQAFLPDDPPIRSITKEQLEQFLASLTVSNKTILNYHIGLSAFWTWALDEGLVKENYLRSITKAKAEKPDIIPFTEDDLRHLITAVRYSKPYARAGKKISRHSLPEADRNYAIILALLDTGLRVSELCHLTIKDSDLRSKDKSIKVINGKGKKDRHLPISSRTATAIWKYLATRPNARLSEPLFATDSGKLMDRYGVAKMLVALEERAGVPDVFPHRFRHTFAINYLKNGGNVYGLQASLGHESMEMCLRYLKIAEVDLDDAHRIASPVDNWNL
jgi:integrase/recombinase XerD